MKRTKKDFFLLVRAYLHLAPIAVPFILIARRVSCLQSLGALPPLVIGQYLQQPRVVVELDVRMRAADSQPPFLRK